MPACGLQTPDDERSRSFDGPDPQARLASRPSGEWNDDDYNVRGYGHHYDRSPTHDYEPTVELASDAA